MDSELLRLIGAILVVLGAVMKLIFKTRRPPLGQIMMISIWLGLVLLVVSFFLPVG